MSKIDELIERLCPDGVEWRALGEIGEFIRGSSIQKKDFVGEGVGCIHYGQIYTHYKLSALETKSFIAPEFARGKRMARSGDLVIATTSENEEDVCKAVVWLGVNEIAVSNDAYIFRHSLNPKYVAYFFQSEIFQTQKKRHISGTKVLRVSGDGMKKISIPIPPLEVQQEIVRVLDSFAELGAELGAELEARRAQYAYYRDKLLDFTDRGGVSVTKLDRWIAHLCPDGVEFHELQEIFTMRNGYTPSKKNPLFWEGGTIPWFRMEDIRAHGRVLDTALQSVNESALKNNSPFPANSILCATSATVGEHALITVDFLANQRFTCLTPKAEYISRLNMNFVYYYCFLLDAWCLENVHKSSFASVDMGGFKKFQFPVPPMEVQERIVGILDKFDSLTNSLTAGLPAEIAARRKQYECYRDKLLAFNEKVA